ncbi:hypothetical protein DW144_07450 [Bifidobacterium adolescentis]|nr:hypothetical protein DW144_07450 [Bifidobacterium adolescentis]
MWGSFECGKNRDNWIGTVPSYATARSRLNYLMRLMVKTDAPAHSAMTMALSTVQARKPKRYLHLTAGLSASCWTSVLASRAMLVSLLC